MTFNNLKIATIGCANNHTYNVEDLGSTPQILTEIIEGSNKFCSTLENAKKPIMIIGDGVYSRVDANSILENLHIIAEKYNFIEEGWNGFNVLHNDASTIGAISLGFTPINQDFSAKNMAEKISSGDMEVLFLLGADEIMIPKDHKGFVIYIGHHGDSGAHIADVILPASAFTEKNATYINNEGRVQKTQLAVLPPNKAVADFEAILKVAVSLNIDLGFDDYKSLNIVLGKAIYELYKHDGKIKFTSTASKIKSDKISPRKINFHSSNSISRNSVTMAACVKEFSTLGDS